jgi:hypothetical protein
MRTYLVFILFSLVFINSARADFILSPGAEVTSAWNSLEKSADQSLLKSNVGFGLLGNMEWRIFSPLSFGIGFGYSSRAGSANYQNSINQTTQLDTSIAQFNAEAGVKLRFINTKRIKVFVGGGLNLGSMMLVFDEDDYFFKNGTLNGFNRSESKGYNGHYFDAGIEYIINNKNALRLSAKHQEIKTKAFENLDNRSLSYKYTSVSIQYMHYVSWSFFVK